MSVRVCVAAVAVLAAATLACASPAAADDGSLLVRVPGDSAGFSRSPGLPLIQADRLAPGTSTSSSFDVRNSSPYSAALRIASSEVEDEENGCLPQEARDPAEDCDSPTGELSQWLSVEVTRHTDVGDSMVWQGAFDELADGVLLAGQMPAETTWPLTVKVTMAREAGNDTMTDLVRFGMRLDAISIAGESAVQTPTGTTSVAGVQASQAGVADVPFIVNAGQAGPQIGLPMTEQTIGLWLLLLDIGLPITAVLLLLALRRSNAARRDQLPTTPAA